MPDLGTFDGLPVYGTSAVIGAGAKKSLAEALDIDPILMHDSDTICVVLECRVADIGHRRKGDGWTRNHKLDAEIATIVDPDTVQEAIELQRAKNRRAEEARKGLKQLPGMLLEEHDRGEHELIDKVDGCPVCFPDATEPAAPPAKPKRAAAAKKTTAKKAAVKKGTSRARKR